MRPSTRPSTRASLLAAMLVAAVQAQEAAAAPALRDARIAILEFKTAPGLVVQAPEALADESRGAVVELTRGAGALVLTRENMLDVLRATGGTCREGECELETARNLNVTHFVAGNVARIDAAWILTLKLFETRSGALLAQERVQASSELALLDRVRPATLVLVRKGFGLGDGPVPTGAASGAPARPLSTTATADTSSPNGGSAGASAPGPVADAALSTPVRFTTTPSGASVTVDGELVCRATPCTRGLAAGRHEVVFLRERHLEARVAMETRPGVEVAAALTPAFGVLRVESSPSGLEVRINEARVGMTPIEREVDTAGVEVSVGDACHTRTGERVALRPGERRTVRYAPPLAQAELRVDATDAGGAPTSGVVFVDGVRMGVTGTVVRVPLCSREVRVAMTDEEWRGPLRLAAGSVTTVRAVARAAVSASRPPTTSVSASASPAPAHAPGRAAPPAAVETAIDEQTGLVWVRMRAGQFTAGCEPQDQDCDSDEKPTPRRDLAGFWMLQTEVPVSAYVACIDKGGCADDAVRSDAPERTCNAPNKRTSHPMNCIDWAHAAEFCRYVGGRLPTALEWEYAAKSASSRVYPWGDEPVTARRANFCDRNCPSALPARDRDSWQRNGWIADDENDGWGGTAPVGTYPAGDTPWGLKDMAGNVFEWTSTSGKPGRMEVRGGGFNYKRTTLRASTRLEREASAHLPSLGFRCAR